MILFQEYQFEGACMCDDKLTKIVATIGPASRSEAVIKSLIQAGVDVFRLNFSHGTQDDHLQTVAMIRKTSNEINKPVAILQDLQGPKIRIGQLENNVLELISGENFVLTTETLTGGIIGGVKKASIDYPKLHLEAKTGDRILMDDGLFELRVEKIEGKELITKVVSGGLLKPRKGVNLPRVKLAISALTEKDRSDLKFAFENNLDYIALSFVRNSKDILELLEIMLHDFDRKIPIIAKIEKPEAMEDIDKIIETVDAIMVARGDLGVETSPQEVPMIQKSLIRKCNLAGKPVITATQMLESMVINPRPTRAEANDVANAIFDGTDAVMLSAETAAGANPVEAVKMMKAIAIQVECDEMYRKSLYRRWAMDEEVLNRTQNNIEDAASFTAIELAAKVSAKAIVTYTHSGGSARKVAKYKPMMPVIAFSPLEETVRRLMLVWGIFPILTKEVATVDEILEGSSEVLKYKGIAAAGDVIVITAGVPVDVPGSTNMIKVERI